MTPQNEPTKQEIKLQEEIEILEKKIALTGSGETFLPL